MREWQITAEWKAGQRTRLHESSGNCACFNIERRFAFGAALNP